MAQGYQVQVKSGKETGLTYQGEEILLQKARGRPSYTHRKLPVKAGWYPDEKKIEAACIFAATTNVTQTTELTGVSAITLRKWRKEGWFLEILDEIRQENDDRLDQKFNSIIETSLDQIQDRVVNGNDELNRKTGEITKVPVPLRELAQAHASIIDKRQLLRGKPTSRSDSGNAGDKLEKLAEEFLKIAKGNQRKTNIIDIEVTENGNGTGSTEGITSESDGISNDHKIVGESREVESV